MKFILFALIISGLSILTASCTKEVKYTKEELMNIAWKSDPSVSLVLPNSMTEGVSCNEYSQGCQSAHIVNVKGLNLIAVEFASEADAVYAAKKFRGYYVRNWLFDDVTGEPILEEFVTQKLQAKKP